MGASWSSSGSYKDNENLNKAMESIQVYNDKVQTLKIRLEKTKSAVELAEHGKECALWNKEMELNKWQEAYRKASIDGNEEWAQTFLSVQAKVEQAWDLIVDQVEQVDIQKSRDNLQKVEDEVRSLQENMNAAVGLVRFASPPSSCKKRPLLLPLVEELDNKEVGSPEEMVVSVPESSLEEPSLEDPKVPCEEASVGEGEKPQKEGEGPASPNDADSPTKNNSAAEPAKDGEDQEPKVPLEHDADKNEESGSDDSTSNSSSDEEDDSSSIAVIPPNKAPPSPSSSQGRGFLSPDAKRQRTH